MCQSCASLIKAIDRYIEKADNDFGKELDNEGYADGKGTAKEIGEFEDEVADALLTETSYIVQKAIKAVSLKAFADEWEKIKDGDKVGEKLERIFKRRFKKNMPKLVSAYLKQTDRSLTLLSISKRTVAWAERWSKDLASLMKLNSHTKIEAILKTGLSKGSGIAEFIRDIQDSGIRDEYYKARRVAVTEVLTAHSVAQQEAFEQSPSVTGKLWRHTGNYRIKPRDNHIDMDGETVPVSEPFTLAGADGGIYRPMYPRDIILPASERINCHCVSEPIVDKEILGLSLEERQRLQAEAIAKMDDDWEKEVDAGNRAKAGIEEVT